MAKQFTEPEQVLEKIICDGCGQEISLRRGDVPYTETEISFVNVHPCDDDVSGEGWCIEDLCEACGKKLGELVAAAGFKVLEIDF